jgi:NAD(P)-dependent dehydrogenase (short-subunit alcohol dehydrogenase family)
MSVSLPLDGTVTIVTGASRGIGEAIARAIVAAGGKVVLASRKIESLEPIARSLGDAAFAVAAHTGREAECDALVDAAVKKFGKVDGLVNNAAANPYFGPSSTPTWAPGRRPSRST